MSPPPKPAIPWRQNLEPSAIRHVPCRSLQFGPVFSSPARSAAHPRHSRVLHASLPHSALLMWSTTESSGLNLDVCSEHLCCNLQIRPQKIIQLRHPEWSSSSSKLYPFGSLSSERKQPS